MGLIRGLLFDNLGLKLMAVLLAVLIYLNVYTDRPASAVVSFPVQLTDLPDSLSLSGAAPDSVMVELRGTGKQIIRLRLSEPVLAISLANVGHGQFERTISPSDLPLGGEDGPQVERLIGPLTLNLTIESRGQVELPVAARVEGYVEEDYTLGNGLVVEPPRVLVIGPQSALAEMDSVRLQPVSVTGARSELRVRVAPSGLPEWCETSPATVMVVVPVGPAE